MTVRVNGETREVPSLKSLGDLLDHLKIQHQAIGILQNGEVVARDTFYQTPFAAGDELEIVRFVGGG